MQQMGGELLFDADWLRLFDARLHGLLRQFHEVRFGRADGAPPEAQEALESMGWSVWAREAETRAREELFGSK